MAVLKTAKESKDSNCKNTSRIVFRERAYSTTGNSRLHYLKSDYIIQLIAFRWDKACIPSSPDLPSLAEVGLACETSNMILVVSFPK